MRTNTIRRAGAVAGAAAATLLGLLTIAAGTASAAPGDVPPLKDRVVRSFATNNLLVPQNGNVNAPILDTPRIGKANATPESQTWIEVTPSRAERNALTKQGFTFGSAVALQFQPSANNRPLCIDVQNDSLNPGAALVLRPCDGTPTQLWERLGNNATEVLRNVRTRLNIEVQNGRAVQQPFVGRIPSGISVQERQALLARNNAQLFFLSPKSFGVGGA
jgi:hypothetical protein